MKADSTLIKLKSINASLLEEINIQRQIIQSTEAIILIINLDLSVHSISKGAEKIIGYTNKELTNKQWFDIVVPKKKYPVFYKGYISFISSKNKTRTIVAPVVCKDKTVKTISWKTNKIYNNKKLIGTVAIGKDVTDIHSQINLLKESEEKFRKLAELLPTPISCKTVDDKIIFLNKAYIQQFGYTLKDIPDFNAWLKVAYKTEVDRKKALSDWRKSVDTLQSGKKTNTAIISVYNKNNEKRILKHDTTISNTNIYCSYYDITEEVLEEQKLKESEEKFRTLAELVPLPVSFITIDGKIVFVNKAYTQQFGYMLDEIPTIKKLFNISYKTSKEKNIAEKYWKEDVKNLTSGIQIKPRRLAVYNKSGQKRIMEYSATLYENFIYYAYLDVTVQVEKEEALLQSKEAFERIAENTPIPVGGCNIETFDLKFSNKKFEEIFGYRYTDNVSFSTWYEKIIYQSEKEREQKEEEFSEYVNALIQNKTPKQKILERQILCIDKAIRTFEIGLTHDNNTMYAFFYDITLRKESEKNLKESESRFRNLAEQMLLPIAFVTADGKFVFLNKAFTQEFGYSLLDFPDIKTVVENTNADTKTKRKGIEMWESEIKKLFATKKPIKKTIEIETKNGSIKLVEYTATLTDNYAYYVYTDITQQKLKEENLIKSRNVFRSIAENTPIAIAGCDIETYEINFINNKFKIDFGYDESELKVYDEWRKHVIHNSKEEKQTAYANWPSIVNALVHRKKSEIKILERKLRRKNGTVGVYEIGLTYDSRTVYAFFYDITDRKLAEERLLASEVRFRSIVENLPLPLLSVNIKSNVIYSNKKHAEIVGHHNSKPNAKTNDISNYSIDDIVNKDDRQRFKSTIELLKNNDTNSHIPIPSYITKIVCKDNIIRTFEVSENIFGDTLYTLFNDVTQQAIAREALMESEQKFRALAENIPIAIGGYDEAGKTIFVNKTFIQTTGYTLEDVPTVKQWYKLTQPNISKRLEFYNYWENLVNSYKNGKLKQPTTIVATALCKDGVFRHFNFSFSVYNNITYLMLTDITEQEKAKKQLEKSHQELRTLTTYLQNVREEERKNISREIHDELGQQLTGIKMAVSAIFKKNIIKDSNDELDRKEIIEMLNTAVKTVRTISTQLRPSILDDLGVTATFEWLIQDFKKRTGIICHCYFDVDEKDVTVQMKNNLFRILQESLTNIMRHAAATTVYIDFFIVSNQLRLIIADNGKGFNKNLPRATLGILGMRERTSVLGGTFNVVSEKTKGTRIIISIPIKTQNENINR